MPRLRTLTVVLLCAIAVATGALLVQPARATDQTIDLDKNPANGQESKVSTKVLQTYPVQIENTIFNNAPGTSFTFNWAGAGPGGFSSYVTAGPGVGTKWVWSTVYQVYSIQAPAAFTPTRALSAFGSQPPGVQTTGPANTGTFMVPGKSIYPTQVTLSNASLSASLITFFSPEKTVASCGVACAPGQCDTFVRNLTGGTVTMTAKQLDCCPEEHQTFCDGTCTSYLTDSNNCGACGNVCGSDQFCGDGVCTCNPGLTECDAACLDAQTDPNNCGACGNVCQSDETCTGGACLCDPGLTQCGDGCLDLQTDPVNCGACDHACYTDEFCSGGACLCDTGLSRCGEACLDLQTDAANCGACGHACRTDEFCSGGACVCDTGLSRCGGECLDLQTDPANCGACGHACYTDEFCSGGACVCAAGLSQCGGECLDLQTDAANCGTCGHVCPVGGSCIGGACACPGGQAACGGTCVDLQNDPVNCGTCGTVCGSNSICSAGSCRACRPPLGTACNNQCVNIHTDPLNCGACGFACDFSNCPSTGQGTCSQGSSCVCSAATTLSTDATGQASKTRLRFKPVHQRSSSSGTTAGVPGTPLTSKAPRTRYSKATSLTSAYATDQNAPARTLHQSSMPSLAPGTTVPSTSSEVVRASGRASRSSVVEAPVCDLAPVEQVLPSGGTYTQTQAGGRFGREIQASVAIAVDGKTVAQGPCPLIVPVTDVDTTGVILSPISVALQDTSGDGLCQPGEARCDYFITVADLGDSPCVNPVATLTSPPDQLDPSPVTFLNGTSSYPSLPAYPGDGVPLEKKTNTTAFAVTTQIDQPPDVGRPFFMNVTCANLQAPVVMPITLGIGSACDPRTMDGRTYDLLQGFQPPVKARLVPPGSPINFSNGNFNHGSTIPLKLSLGCGNVILSDADINPKPQIVSLEHTVLGPQSLLGINGDNNANPDNPRFSCSSSACDFQFRTDQLPIGTYIIGVQMPDTRIFKAGFTISP